MIMKAAIIISLLLFINLSNLNAQNESFDDFINSFAQDSVFQLSRIVFPLSIRCWDYEVDQEVTITINEKKWQFDRLHYSIIENGGDAYTVFYDNFDCKFSETDEMVFRWRGFTDMDTRYYFKRVDGLWFLIMIMDYDYVYKH